ncbi:MAG TPA: adenylate/guanylate cyclase domain-containing protein [Gaiellaceae bacterium]|nr:adenylate/guanylate cyclase domain-containing protein [Gaiellaceae bacterium]
MQVPETRYARSGDVNIAYQVVGDGSVDLLWIPVFAQHVELSWEDPYRRAWLEALASDYRLIVFDKRGTGLSDHVVGAPSVEVRMDDCRVVLDAAGSRRAAVLTSGDASDLGVVFAATYPDRVHALVTWEGRFRGTWAPDYPWAPPREEELRRIDESERRWPASLEEEMRAIAPSLDPSELDAFTRVTRLSVSPGSAAAFRRLALDVDVRDVLRSVRVPVLVMSRAGGPSEEAGRWAVTQLPAGEFVAVDRPDWAPVVGDTAPLLDHVRRFVTRAVESRVTDTDRILATVLFTDIVGSTARAAELGDQAWRALLERHHSAVRDQLVRFRGVEHDTAGDGFFASFDGPARAIRCACAIRDTVEELGLELRAGVHSGECELLDGKIAGIAVATAARVSAHAGPGDVLVSQTVKDLVAGSGIQFDDRGTTELRGVPGEWRLYAVAVE